MKWHTRPERRDNRYLGTFYVYASTDGRYLLEHVVSNNDKTSRWLVVFRGDGYEQVISRNAKRKYAEQACRRHARAAAPND